MANLSNINNVLRTGSLGVGINRDPLGAFEISSATKPGIKMFNTAADGKTYEAYSDVSGNYIIYDQNADDNRLVISSGGNSTFSGNVGIGISPGENLHIFKSDATALIQASNTSGIAQLQFFPRDASNVAHLQSIKGIDSNLTFLTGGNSGNSYVPTEKMRIDSSGHVGIRTIPQTTLADFCSIEIGNIGMIMSEKADSQYNSMFVSSNAYYASGWKRKTATVDGSTYMSMYLGGIRFGTAPQGAADSAITWTNQLIIANNGNATFAGSITGVGATFLGAAASGAALVTIENNSGSTATSYGLLVKGGGNSSSGKTFEVRDDSGNTDLIVKGNGNVGIGTDSPLALLNIEGPNNQDGNDYAQLYIKGTGTYPDDIAGIVLDSAGSNQSHIRFHNNGTPKFQIRYNSGNVSDDSLFFYSFTQASDMVTMDGATGNVGIGTNSPNKELTLGGADGTQTLSFTTSAYLGDQAVIGNIEFSTHDADASYKQLANIYALKTGTNTNSGDITFWTKRNGARSEKIRIESTGDLRVKEGSIVIDSTSQGIFLGGTATTNKLDFYKTDTWAPQIYYQNATDQANATNSTQVGLYTRIGNMCMVQFRLVWVQASGTPAVDNIGIKNLPFGGSTTNTYAEVPCFLIGYTGGPSPRGNLVLTLPISNSTLALFNDTNHNGNMGNAIGSGTKEIRFSFTYTTNG